MTTSESSAKAGLFLRKSSGLIRAFSPFDGFAYGIYAVSIIVAAAFSYAIAFQWPKANIPLAIVLNCLGLLPMCVVYAMISTLMPRAGGDYIWQSRILSSPVAYMLAFVVPVTGPWYFMASNCTPGPGMVVAPLFISLGAIFNSEGFYSIASWLSTPVGGWWFYVFYVTFAAGVMVMGMKFYAKLQKWSFIIGCVALAIWVIIILTSSNTVFPSQFGAFMQKVFSWGDGNAYNKILDMAQTNGYTAYPLSKTNFLSSLLIGPVIGYAFVAIVWGGNLVGEIGGLNKFKNSLFVYAGGIIFCMVVCSILMWLLISRIGNEFFTSANFLWMGGYSDELPVAPYFGVFMMAMSKSPLIWLLISIGLSAWFWIWPTNNFVGSTRVSFAMSYDRMLPGFVAKVSGRTGAPTTAILICYVMMLIFGWLALFTSFSSLTLVMPLLLIIFFSASVLSGMLMPYKEQTKELYWGSPISKYKILGVPAVTVIGALSLIYNGFMFIAYIVDPRYGTNSLLSYAFISGICVLGLVIYFVYRAYRRRIGIDTDLTYKEIPTD